MMMAARVASFGRRTVYSLPNKVSEYRKPFVANPHLVGADNPTWLKGGKSDEYIAWVAGGLCTCALLMTFKGLYHMATGTGKLD